MPDHLPELSTKNTQASSSIKNAFLERGMGQRHSKKFFFDKEGRHDHLQKICDQIMEKNDRDISAKVSKIIDEKRNLLDSTLQHRKE